MADNENDISLEVRCDWDHAIGEYDLYKRHGRPNGPYYVKCLNCGDIYEEESILEADYETRYHAGYHGGLKEEHAEILVTDRTGRELWRHHAIHRPEDEPEACEACGWPLDDEHRVSCENCGSIPERAKL